MANLVIDGKNYDIEKLSPEAKIKLDSARFCDQKIERLEADLAVVRTARVAYLQSMATLLTDDALIIETKKPAAKKSKAPAKKPSKTTNH